MMTCLLLLLLQAVTSSTTCILNRAEMANESILNQKDSWLHDEMSVPTHE
jgi:hypothetical protein